MSLSQDSDGRKLEVTNESVYGRFKLEKEQARDRMDVEELTNHDFMSILLDVYDLHKDDD